MKFTIDRKTWLNGDSLISFLLRGFDQKMCCLGQVSEQCGIPKDRLLDVCLPMQLEMNDLSKLPEWIQEKELALEAMEVNDNPWISDKERESKLQEIFKKHGDELEFVNDYE